MAGRYVGSYDTEKKFAALPSELSGQQSASTFFILDTAIRHLQEAKVEEANRVLVNYAKVQIPGIVACTKSPSCKAFAGKLLPSPDSEDRTSG